MKKPKKNEAFLLIKKRKNILNNYYYLSKKNNLNEVAKNLYSCLRKIKKMVINRLQLKKFQIKGLGKTINDRLIGFKVLETNQIISLMVRLLGVEPRTS